MNNSPIERLLIAEQPRLGQRVIGHAGVTVHVIGSDVQQHAYGRAKELNRLELERADFEREKIQIASLVDHGADRRPDVSGGKRLDALGGQEPLDHLGRRGLSVRARDCNVEAERVLVTQFELANDWHPALAHFAKRRVVPRHSGADHDKIKRSGWRFGDTKLHLRPALRARH